LAVLDGTPKVSVLLLGPEARKVHMYNTLGLCMSHTRITFTIVR